MLETVTLQTLDQHSIRAVVARPTEPPRGCVVVIQEIFGVTEPIRWVLTEQYARAGYLAVAPCFFDRLKPGLEFDYSARGVARARASVDQLGWDAPLRDIRAAEQQIGQGMPTAVVGYCWGGTLACLAATRLGLPAVSYYGARTPGFLHERLQAPLQLHFGEHDPLIPLDTVRTISRAFAESACHLYPAGHGFNRFGHADWHAESAERALARALGFLRQHLSHASPEVS